MNKKRKINSSKIVFFVLPFIFSFFVAGNVYAGLVPCGLDGAADCTLCHLVVGFYNIYKYLLGLLFAATTTVIVIAGIKYMVSSGNKGMIEKAKAALTYALTAIILALTAWLIINATLHALGFKNAGNWWTFTCDTTQTPPPAQNPSGGSGTGKGGGISGKGRDISVPQDGTKLAQALEKYKGAVYVNYTKENGNPNGPKGWINGVFYGDCSSFTQAIYKDVYGVDIPRTAKEQWNQSFDYSKLVNGTLISSGTHIGVYFDGSVYHNSGTNRDVRVVNLDNYLKQHKVVGMRLPSTQNI